MKKQQQFMEKMWPTVEEWMAAHKHSSSTIEYELGQALENNPDDMLEVLEEFKGNMENLKAECMTEIKEADYWIKKIQREKRNNAREKLTTHENQEQKGVI